MEWKLTLMLQSLQGCAGHRQVWKQFVDAAAHQPILISTRAAPISTRAALEFLLLIHILSMRVTNPCN